MTRTTKSKNYAGLGKNLKRGGKALGKSVRGVGDIEAHNIANVHLINAIKPGHPHKSRGIFGSGLGAKK